MTRLPIPGSDNGQWGQILNDFLSVEHNTDGSFKTTPVPLNQKGAANGVAQLDSSSKLAIAHIPASVETTSTLDVAGHAASYNTVKHATGLAMNPKAAPWNAKGDGVQVTDGAMTSGSSIVTTASYTFTSADVGKLITVFGAGNSGAVLVGTIIAVGGGATISVAASTTVSSATVNFGTDDTAALSAFFAAGNNANHVHGYIPSGMYMVTSGLTCPPNMSIDADHDAVICAGANGIGTLWTGMATFRRDRALVGLTIDCNGLAGVGISLGTFGRFRLVAKVMNQTGHAIIVGNTGGYGCIGSVYIWRDPTLAVPSGSYGLWLKSATDCEFAMCEVVGADIGVRNDSSGNHFTQVHVWGWGLSASAFPTICFDDNSSGATYVSCVADTPTIYGYRFRQYGSKIFGGAVFNNASGTDNSVIGIKVDVSGAQFVINGVAFSGADASHRLAKAFDAVNPTRSTLVGNTYGNVVTVPQEFIQIQGSSSGFQAFNSTGVSFFATQGGNKSVQMPNSALLQGYSGNFTSETGRWDFTTGALTTGKGITSARPLASTVGAGGQWFDTTLNKPIWSDGVAWRDATGTIV
jgi:hypothetical protein